MYLLLIRSNLFLYLHIKDQFLVTFLQFLKYIPAIFLDTFNFTMLEMIFWKEYYEDMKDYFHPHIHSFINNYAHDDLYFLPPYHGCGLKNRNGTRKLIDYRNGKQCLFPDWSQEKIFLIVYIDHLLGLCHIMERTDFLKKIKEIVYLITILINVITCRTRLLEIIFRDFFK